VLGLSSVSIKGRPTPTAYSVYLSVD